MKINLAAVGDPNSDVAQLATIAQGIATGAAVIAGQPVYPTTAYPGGVAPGGMVAPGGAQADLFASPAIRAALGAAAGYFLSGKKPIWAAVGAAAAYFLLGEATTASVQTSPPVVR